MKDVHSRHWGFLKNGMMELSSPTASGIVVSDTQAKVYIEELGAYLWVHLVKDSPSVLSLGRPNNELDYSYSWPTRETP